MLRPAFVAALLVVSMPAAAEDDVPGRRAELTVYGEDPCPPSTDDEIVVCHRRPEDERYRIPAPLRRSSHNGEQSWGTRVETLDEVSRDTRPNSCSVVGAFGQSGCTQQMIRQWYAERRARRSGP